MPQPARTRHEAAPAPCAKIDAAALRRALGGGAAALLRQADALNAINVFPVPDGDTGTNMSQTMRDAVAAVDAAHDDLRAIASAAAKGALLGAKGNSGVILSQIISGFAALPVRTATLDATALADALERGRVAAYGVVTSPKEGTILTAISAAAAGARDSAGRSPDAEAALATAVGATHAAVARTPELLPVLKEAGVVDAGAQGLYVLLDGMLHGLRGEQAAAAEDLGAIDPAWLAATSAAHGDGARSGFCTEFVLKGDAIDAGAVRARLASMGESLLVVAGSGIVRVHVHTSEPDPVLAYASTLGDVTYTKADDMEAQFRALARRNGPAADGRAARIGVVAVAAGAGIEALMRSLGAAVVVRGGQTMNPSAGEIRAAIEEAGADRVVLLPGNKNILLAARQAAEGAGADVRVLDATTIPESIAALIAMNPEASLDENTNAMRDAIADVETAEVTLAARATTVNGLAIGAGQPIGIIDGELTVAGATVTAVAQECVRRIVARRDATLVTLYAGADHDPVATAQLAEALRSEFGIEVEVVDGGQPHYPYLIGAE